MITDKVISKYSLPFSLSVTLPQMIQLAFNWIHSVNSVTVHQCKRIPPPDYGTVLILTRAQSEVSRLQIQLRQSCKANFSKIGVQVKIVVCIYNFIWNMLSKCCQHLEKHQLGCVNVKRNSSEMFWDSERLVIFYDGRTSTKFKKTVFELWRFIVRTRPYAMIMCSCSCVMVDIHMHVYRTRANKIHSSRPEVNCF